VLHSSPNTHAPLGAKFPSPKKLILGVWLVSVSLIQSMDKLNLIAPLYSKIKLMPKLIKVIGIVNSNGYPIHDLIHNIETIL